jgi:hypothetical protein
MSTETLADLELAQAREFLEAIAPNEERFTFFTADDLKGRDAPELRRTYHGTLEEHAPALARANVAGAGVFVTINRTDLQGRRLANIMGIRAVWHDHDNPAAPVPNFPLLAMLQVETSPGKVHTYWPVADGLAPAEHRAIEDALAERYGHDVHAKDLARVMRLPGSRNMKDPARPHPVAIKSNYARFMGQLSPDDVRSAFIPNGIPERPTLPSAPIGDMDAARVRSALACLDPTPRDTWLQVGMALHHETDGSAEGRELWDEWSANCPGKFSDDEQDKAWSHFGKDLANPVTLGTIVALARQSGWTDPAQLSEFADVIEPPPAPADEGLEFEDAISIREIREHDRRALVRGLIHPGSTGMLYGDSGAGKTFVALDIAWHVARGVEWAGRRVVQAPVLYASLEGNEGFRKRMLAAKQVHGPAGKMFARYTLPVRFVRGQDGDASVADMARVAGKLGTIAGQPVGLIVLDTLARAMAGDDENSTSDMTHFIERRASEIARVTGAAVMIVHHKNKSGAVRGSGALYGACDFVLEAKSDEKGRALFVHKNKDGEAGPLFSYELSPVVLESEADADPEPSTSCIVLRKAPGADVPPIDAETAETSVVLGILGEFTAAEIVASNVLARMADDPIFRGRSREHRFKVLQTAVDCAASVWSADWTGKTGGILKRKS